MHSKNDVISVVTVGGEIVGKFLRETTTDMTIADPHMVTPNGESIGFIPAVSMTGVQSPKEVTIQKGAIVLTVKTAEEVEREWRKATSGLII